MQKAIHRPWGVTTWRLNDGSMTAQWRLNDGSMTARWRLDRTTAQGRFDRTQSSKRRLRMLDRHRNWASKSRSSYLKHVSNILETYLCLKHSWNIFEVGKRSSNRHRETAEGSWEILQFSHKPTVSTELQTLSLVQRIFISMLNLIYFIVFYWRGMWKHNFPKHKKIFELQNLRS